MKEGRLFVLFFFCTYEIHWIGMLQIAFLVSLESSQRGGVHRLGCMAFGLALQKSLNIEWFSSLKIKLNRSWKFRRNWNVHLVLLETSWCAGLNGIYLVRFGYGVWEILIFMWFLLLKIQINLQKTRLWKKKWVEDVVTLGPTAQATLVFWKSGPASQNRCHAQAFIYAVPWSKGIKYHSTFGHFDTCLLNN
jgi:hypothetical protein